MWANQRSWLEDLGAGLRQTTLRPSATALAESLRDLGYSLETAVSDIIDNSISAQAGAIDIWCVGDAEHLNLAIIDDGVGMDEATLLSAMRPGSSDPRHQRASTDLGRFGLGLKTASFSQGRRLTVVSRTGGASCAASWDLDLIGDHDEWVLSLPDPDEITAIPWLEKLPRRGTLVLWEKLDRLSEHLTGRQRSETVAAKLVSLEKHLSLVFHRFLAGELAPRRRLTIRLNGRRIEAFDPFCRAEPATQPLPHETLTIGSSVIHIRPFILPHHSRLSPATLEFYRSRSDFLSNQGAYVYRNGRLMAWGDWFRMIPKGEATNLARVQIDFSSELDDQWTIDIKKSRAHPPLEVRQRFRQIIERIAGKSVRVYSGRAERALRTENLPMWVRLPERAGMSYLPNLQHPLIHAALGECPADARAAIERVLAALGTSLPLDAIHADLIALPAKALEATEMTEEDCRARLLEFKSILDSDNNLGAEEFIRIARSTKALAVPEEVLERIARTLYQ